MVNEENTPVVGGEKSAAIEDHPNSYARYRELEQHKELIDARVDNTLMSASTRFNDIADRIHASQERLSEQIAATNKALLEQNNIIERRLDEQKDHTYAQIVTAATVSVLALVGILFFIIEFTNSSFITGVDFGILIEEIKQLKKSDE